MLALVTALLAFPAGSASARVVCAVPSCESSVGLPLALPFDGDRGGVLGSGFTLVDTGSGGGDLRADHLAVDDGALRVTTTSGVAFRTANSLDNTLGVTVPVRERGVILETELLAPPSGTCR